MKVNSVSWSRPRNVCDRVEAFTVAETPLDARTMYSVIGSPLASAVVMAGQVTFTPPPRGLFTRSAVMAPAGLPGRPAGCSATDQLDHSEGSGARLWARTRYL